MIMVVGVDSPYKNAADFIAAAKANPGKMTVGTAGHGSPQHLAVAAFAAAAGIQLSYVPFKGAAPALVATVGRLLVGNDQRRLIPVATALGACLLAAADAASRYMGQVPVGVLTGFLGGPFFLFLLWKSRKTGGIA